MLVLSWVGGHPRWQELNCRCHLLRCLNKNHGKERQFLEFTVHMSPLLLWAFPSTVWSMPYSLQYACNMCRKSVLWCQDSWFICIPCSIKHTISETRRSDNYVYFHVNLNFSKFNKKCICWWVYNIYNFQFYYLILILWSLKLIQLQHNIHVWYFGIVTLCDQAV